MAKKTFEFYLPYEQDVEAQKKKAYLEYIDKKVREEFVVLDIGELDEQN